LYFLPLPQGHGSFRPTRGDARSCRFPCIGKLHPRAGAIIQDTGGLRKVRWASGGSGKRGGVRVIYFHAVSHDQVRMLLIYRKGMKDDLSAAEKKVLRKLNENW
jgi:hypothetical protein